MDVQSLDDETLRQQYELVCKAVKDILNKQEDLKTQLKINRENKHKLAIELQLRGLEENYG